jgi:hypothetical protein
MTKEIPQIITVQNLQFQLLSIDTEIIQILDELHQIKDGMKVVLQKVGPLLEMAIDICPEIEGVFIVVRNRGTSNQRFAWKGTLEGLVELMLELSRCYFEQETKTARSEEVEKTCIDSLAEIYQQLKYIRGETDDVLPDEQQLEQNKAEVLESINGQPEQEVITVDELNEPKKSTAGKGFATVPTKSKGNAQVSIEQQAARIAELEAKLEAQEAVKSSQKVTVPRRRKMVKAPLITD